VGLFFRQPVLDSAEHTRFQGRADWSSKRFQHGGLLTVTDRRLICVPNRVDVGGRTVEIALDRIESAQMLSSGLDAALKRGPAALWRAQVQLEMKGDDSPTRLFVKVAEPDRLLQALRLPS
jgi:hypothetical protein